MYLPLHDRLKCKEVCERWYEILMERAKFRGDRHIYLRKCMIKANQPPMSVFMQAKYLYDILSIQTGVKFDNLDDLIQFGRYLGLKVTEVVLNRFHHKNCKVYMIVGEMPLVKSLTLKNMKVNKVTAALELIHSQEPTFRLHFLEKLTIRNKVLVQSEQMPSFAKAVKDFFRNKAEIIINRVNLKQGIAVDKLLPIMKLAKIHELSIDASERTNAEMEMLFEADNLYFECLQFIYYSQSEQSPYPYLQAFLDKNKHLKDITLSCCYSPPTMAFPKITKLHLELTGSRKSLKPLDLLVNLQSLSITSGIPQECGIIHEPVNLLNLQTFSAYVPWFCEECLETLYKSFKNIKDTTISTRHQLTSNKLKRFIKNWSLLEDMHFVVDKFDLQEEDFDFRRERLRMLSIFSNSDLSISALAIKELSKTFPNLRTLTFNVISNFEFIPSLEDVVQAFVPAFSKLFVLQFWSDFHENPPTIDKFEIGVIVKHLVKHGYPLEVIKILLNSVEGLN